MTLERVRWLHCILRDCAICRVPEAQEENQSPMRLMAEGKGMRLSPNLPQVDQHAIYNALTLLHAPGSVVELRIPNAVTGQRGLRKKYRSTVAGFYNDFAALAQEAVTWSGKSDGVYITLNVITPDLLARYANRVEEGAEALTNDRHVIRRHWLPIDFDATRLAKISSTGAEHEAALQRAIACRAWLHDQHWPDPLSEDSGNGAHLLYRLDLPNDEASTTLVARVLQALALLFNDTHVTVAILRTEIRRPYE